MLSNSSSNYRRETHVTKKARLKEQLELLDKLSAKLKKITWPRAKEHNEYFEFIVEGIDSADILQGYIKNAYFVSSISAICEFDSRIKRLLIQDKMSEKGIYKVAIHRMGNWREIIVDDRLPVIKNTNRVDKLIGSNSAQNELWVSILEKAYAKAFGGYYEIGNGGDPRISLYDLTGAPCEMIPTVNYSLNEKMFWKKLMKIDKSNFIICCGSKSDEEIVKLYPKECLNWQKIKFANSKSNFTREYFGIVPSHLYTLIGVEIAYGQRLVLLRNTWGNLSWKKGSNIEQNDRNKCSKLAEDGQFYIPFENFFELFKQVTVCYYIDSNKTTSIEDKFNNQRMRCYELEIEQPGDYYISISQEDIRQRSILEGIIGLIVDYDYKKMGLLLISADSDFKPKLKIQETENETHKKVNEALNAIPTALKRYGPRYRGGYTAKFRDIWIKVSLEVGRNLLYLHSPFKITQSFGVSVYGPANVKINRCTDIEVIEDHFFRGILSKVDMIGGNLEIRECEVSLPSELYSYRVVGSTDGFGFQLYENNGQQSITLQIIGKIGGGAISNF